MRNTIQKNGPVAKSFVERGHQNQLMVNTASGQPNVKTSESLMKELKQKEDKIRTLQAKLELATRNEGASTRTFKELKKQVSTLVLTNQQLTQKLGKANGKLGTFQTMYNGAKEAHKREIGSLKAKAAQELEAALQQQQQNQQNDDVLEGFKAWRKKYKQKLSAVEAQNTELGENIEELFGMCMNKFQTLEKAVSSSKQITKDNAKLMEAIKECYQNLQQQHKTVDALALKAALAQQQPAQPLPDSASSSKLSAGAQPSQETDVQQEKSPEPQNQDPVKQKPAATTMELGEKLDENETTVSQEKDEQEKIRKELEALQQKAETDKLRDELAALKQKMQA
jgi:hypothetical protein